MKKLLLLGGSRYLMPVIRAAHKLGVYVITCDYLPDNYAHAFADQYINASIIDRDLILKIAREENVDGVMSFATDPGVLTAAYVAEKLGLPSCGSFESVQILQNKDLFRAFLKEHGFQVPEAHGYSSLADVMADADSLPYPVIVKPVDSAGSKGVSRVDLPEALETAVKDALDKSFDGRIIVERFIEQTGCSSDSDCFSIDGKLVFASFSAQRFDRSAANPYTPAAYSWPSTFTAEQEAELRSELQRLITLLGLKTSLYNIETRVGTDGVPYIMEVSPRGGGNRLSECLKLATGQDLIKNAVLAALGQSCEPLTESGYQGAWAEVILHSTKSGTFSSLEIDPAYQPFVEELDLWVKPGDAVQGFHGANETIGTMILKFDSVSLPDQAMETISQWVNIKLEA